jgi:ribonuclease E
VQRWPETKRLLGLFVNSSGRAHGRNARRLVHAARQQDRRLAVALLAAAVAHTPEAEEVLRGARMRTARKPSAVARELLRNFPKGGSKRRRRRRRGEGGSSGSGGGSDRAKNSKDGGTKGEKAEAEAGAEAAAQEDLPA